MKNNIIKIATYNIRTDVQETNNTKKQFLWDNRFPSIKKLILQEDWDIIGFQEPTERQFEDLKTLKDYGCVGKKRSNSLTAEYNPIFYKKEKFELLDQSTQWLTDKPNNKKYENSWGASLPRIFTVAKFRMKYNDSVFYIINTHFDHISENARYESSKLITRYIEKNMSNKPVIITGDFNGEPEERFYKVLSKKFNSVVEESKDHTGPIATFPKVELDEIPEQENMSEIDYIFINNKITVEKTKIMINRFNNCYPSDHFPISAVIRFE